MYKKVDLVKELNRIGASWFVSYAYYEKFDKTHRNWEYVSTLTTRINGYNRNKQYHRIWLEEILQIKDYRLGLNKLGLSASDVKKMARELLK